MLHVRYLGGVEDVVCCHAGRGDIDIFLDC